VKHLVIEKYAACWSNAFYTMRCLRLLGLSVLPALSAHAEDMVDGSAIVTSSSGSVSAINTNGDHISVDAHDVLLPAGVHLSTGKKGQIFLTLSNGVALGLDEESILVCAAYTQRPFDKEEQIQRLEPTVSNLSLQLEKGQLAIASNQLSPLSEIRVDLPFGQVRLIRGSCLIRYDAAGLLITALEGTLTYYYPGGDARDYITTPKSLRISKQSAERHLPLESSTIDSLALEGVRLSQATQHASRRVIFEPNKATGQAPVPVLIVRPEYFEQPSIRPYTFKD